MMRRLFHVVFVALLLLIAPIFALAEELTDGYWDATEINWNNISIPIESIMIAEEEENTFSLALDISQNNVCSLYISNIEFPAVLKNESNNTKSISVGNREFILETNKNDSLSINLTDELKIRLEKKDRNPDFSDYLKIEDILEDEKREEDLLKIKEAESAALAALKTTSIYEMKVHFSEQETSKMSAYMNYGRYYFDGNIMFGMAFDKSGYLPNLVKSSVSLRDNTPAQEAFIVLDRHVNANFLTKYKDKLYYIRVDRNSGLSSLAYINLKTEKVVIIGTKMHEMAYLQIHGGRLWYTGDEHRLYSCLLNGKDNRIELNKSVYDPYFLTEDWLIYQDEDDNETLHVRCIKDDTDLKITASRSFNPIVDDTFLYFTSIPDDGGKAYLSRIDLSMPRKEELMCYKIEKSDLPMSNSFFIFNSVIYGENNSSVSVNDWKKMTNNAWSEINQRYFYLGEQYYIFGEMYPDNATVSYMYLCSQNTGARSLFRHVY